MRCGYSMLLAPCDLGLFDCRWLLNCTQVKRRSATGKRSSARDALKALWSNDDVIKLVIVINLIQFVLCALYLTKKTSAGVIFSLNLALICWSHTHRSNVRTSQFTFEAHETHCRFSNSRTQTDFEPNGFRTYAKIKKSDSI